MFGRGLNGHEVYLIDFGLSSLWVDSHGNHIPYSTNAKFRGTDKYASVNNHNRIEASRRDDLESLGYVLIMLLNGTLPWFDIKQAKVDVAKVKQATTLQQLTEKLPGVFHDYFVNVQRLEFSTQPDYDYLRKIFLNTLHTNGWSYDNVFEWAIQFENQS